MAAKVRVRAQQSKRGKARARKQTSRPPVYFRSLSLENVRCFGPRQTLQLSDATGRPARWTVILGNNGLGKTTLLQALTLFEPEPVLVNGETHYFDRSLSLLVTAGHFRNALRHQAKQAWLRAELDPGALDAANRSRGEPIGLVCTFGGETHGASQGTTEPIGELVCYGYGATRRLGSGSLSTPSGPSSNNSLFFEDVPLRNAEEWLLQADYASSKQARHQGGARARRDRIKQLLCDLLPEVKDLRFSPPDKQFSAAHVEVQTPYGWVAMRDLSLGYRTLIAWMVDFASRLFERYPDSANPLAEPAVVLVDEIDLHLHPTWQRQLIGHLSEKFPNTQFIVTAHSPLVVQSAQDANIVVLRREGDHVVIDNDVESIRGWRVDQILTSDLFGLESARPPQLEPLLQERTRLLSKSRLTARDRARLQELEAAIGPLPTGETPTEREALEFIQRTAKRLKGERT